MVRWNSWQYVMMISDNAVRIQQFFQLLNDWFDLGLPKVCAPAPAGTTYSSVLTEFSLKREVVNKIHDSKRRTSFHFPLSLPSWVLCQNCSDFQILLACFKMTNVVMKQKKGYWRKKYSMCVSSKLKILDTPKIWKKCSQLEHTKKQQSSSTPGCSQGSSYFLVELLASEIVVGLSSWDFHHLSFEWSIQLPFHIYWHSTFNIFNQATAQRPVEEYCTVDIRKATFWMGTNGVHR